MVTEEVRERKGGKQAGERSEHRPHIDPQSHTEPPFVKGSSQ